MQHLKENDLYISILKTLNPDVKISDPFKLSLYDTNKERTSYSFIERFFLSSFYYKKKFQAFKEMRDNIFISDKEKNLLTNSFNKSQFLFHFFKKFYIRKTYDKYKIHNNDRDFNLLPLSNYNKKFIVSIIEDNIIYKYTIFDLLKIIKNSLCYSYAMFVEPKEPKNPYTNISFSLYNLYNIYFITKNLDITFPVLLNVYFKSNFDLDLLIIDYESILRDEIIKNYYSDASNTKKYNDIIQILDKYKKYAPTLIIHRRFSKNEVIEKLGFLLPINLYINYSYNPSKRIYYKKLIKKHLIEFNEKNPLFGRIIFTRNTRTSSIFSNDIYNSSYDYSENILSPTGARTYSFASSSSSSPIRNWYPLNLETDTNTVVSNISSINLDNDISETTEDNVSEPIIEEPDSDDELVSDIEVE